MKNTKERAALVAALTYVGVSSLALAQEDPIIVTASRLPELLSSASSEVELFKPEEIEARQQDRLQDVLNLTPGVQSTSLAGQEGGLSSLFIRGLNTEYNQLVIDGVGVSSSLNGGNSGAILGAFQFSGGDQLEVVLGAEGVVHGSATTGGLVGVVHSFDNAVEGTSFFTEFGGDEYLNYQFSHVDSFDNIDYYFNSNFTELEHDGVDNEFENRQVSAGLRYRVSVETSLIFTARGGMSDFQFPSRSDQTDYEVGSLKLVQEKEDYSGSTVLGYFNTEFDSGGTFRTNYEKFSLTSDHRWNLNEIIKLGLGVDASLGEFEESGFVNRTVEEDIISAHINVEGDFGPVVLSASFRGEENSLFGFLPSWDIGASLSIDTLGSELYFKASQGVRSPNFNESGAFRTQEFTQLSNPDLEEEEITSLELTYTQKLKDSLQFSVTGYAHFIDNAIQSPFNFIPELGGFVGVGSNQSGNSEVFGVDFGLSGSFADNLNYKLAWNYNIKNDIVDGFPRNTVAADLHYNGGDWSIGAGVSHRSNANFGGGDLGSSLVTRLYGHYQLTDHIQLTARVENLFDEDYLTDPFASFDPVTFESVAGVTGRGRSFYAGIKATW